MSNIWDRYESIASVEEVSASKAKYAPIEAGDYEVVLESIKPAENKNGLPMIKGMFVMLEGGRKIPYNQNLQNVSNPAYTADNIYDATVFIGCLLGEEVVYAGMVDFAAKIESIPTGTNYTLNVSYGKKDLERKFPRLKVVSRGEPEVAEPLPFDL